MLMQGLPGDRPLRSSVYSHQNNLGLGCYQLVQHCPLVVSVGITENLSTARVLYVPVAFCFPFSFKCFLKSPHVYLNNDRQDNILFFKLNGAPLWYTPVKPAVKGLSQEVVMSSLPEIYSKLKNGLAIPRIPASK